LEQPIWPVEGYYSNVGEVLSSGDCLTEPASRSSGILYSFVSGTFRPEVSYW